MMLVPRSRLADLWDRARNSYWFVPSIMFVGAFFLAAGMVELDLMVGQAGGLDTESLFPKFDADAARSILTTIASVMVTVTGIVFSLTIVSLQLASSQFGPRLLRTFMSSLGNQIVMGTFLATFIFCLVVVGTVRDQGFVPQLSTAAGILLGVIDVAVLIYFVHHVATSIRIETMIARITEDLRAVIDAIFPTAIGDPPPGPGAADNGCVSLGDDYQEVRAAAAGYIRHIDGTMLMSLAKQNDLVLRLARSPGDFVVDGTVLSVAWPAARVTDEVAQSLRESVVIGRDRTPLQDVAFAIRQLVEVALRALSPGINDPFTAIECINRLAEGLCIVVGRPRPSPVRYDDDGCVRVIARPLEVDEMTHLAFDPIARAGGSNGDVAVRLLEMIGTVSASTSDPVLRTFFAGYLAELKQQLLKQLPLERDREALANCYNRVRAQASPEANGLPAATRQAAHAPTDPLRPVQREGSAPSVS
jgi:uncharacterized membrane protein